MSNMKIGEIKAFKCVEVKEEDNCCVGCMFNDESCCWVDVEIFGHCEKAYREDGKNVIFVRVDPNEIIHEKNPAAGNEDQLKNEDLKPFVKICKWCMENDTDHCDVKIITDKGRSVTISVAFSEEEDAVQD